MTESSLVTTRSQATYNELCSVIPGGVNSPFRGYQEVGGSPVLFNKGQGASLSDLDGNTYLDYVGGWGPMILGHGHPRVAGAVKEMLDEGFLLGSSHPLELECARLVQKAFPSMAMVRFVNSGTEAVQSAVRLARACTKKDKVLRFEGSYHGHVDGLVDAFGVRKIEGTGVPESIARNTLSGPFNDVEALRNMFEHHAKELACVLVEPVAGSMGVVAADPEFLKALRELTSANRVVLIFDEVLTGFRVAFGGAQERYGIQADLTCLGKILGGGLPAGAYGGKAELMQRIAPGGPVYQAGTFSGNPLTMRASIETLNILAEENVYDELDRTAGMLEEGLVAAAKSAKIPVQVPRVGSMFSVMFTHRPPRNIRDAEFADSKRFAAFFHGMLNRGVFFPPSLHDAAFVSTAHTRDDIEKTVEAAEEVFKSL
ncbi:MAG: glutamate-1-semialdehyde 2,1-aminomutase [Armatimonadetes bacterium]|nr:glutamate-1-semialdehyde 2,1-aminomutase [Armatimonadota bacterium]